MLHSSFAVYKINRSFIIARYVLYYCWLLTKNAKNTLLFMDRTVDTPLSVADNPG